MNNGGKGLKNEPFWVINFAPPAANIVVGEKIYLSKGGPGGMIEMHNI